MVTGHFTYETFRLWHGLAAADWTEGFHWWRSGNKKRTQNVSEYMLVLALCLVKFDLTADLTGIGNRSEEVIKWWYSLMIVRSYRWLINNNNHHHDRFNLHECSMNNKHTIIQKDTKRRTTQTKLPVIQKNKTKHCPWYVQHYKRTTYLYAPKDDYKHRLDWRELYTEEQAGMYPCSVVCLWEAVQTLTL